MSALEEYRRVIFYTVNLGIGERVYKNGESYHFTRDELNEMDDETKEQLAAGSKLLEASTGYKSKLLEFYPVQIIEVNGMYPLNYNIKRQIGSNPAVMVKSYMFFNYDKTHALSFACRVEDEHEYNEFYEKMLNSFKLY